MTNREHETKAEHRARIAQWHRERGDERMAAFYERGAARERARAAQSRGDV